MASENNYEVPTFGLHRGLLQPGAALMGVGGLLFLVGATLGAVAVVGAGRRYLRQTEEGPTQIARRRWEQFKGVVVVAPKGELPDGPNRLRGAHAHSAR